MYKVNLLPPELQRDISVDIRRLVKWLTVSLVVIILVLGYGIFLYSFFSTKKEIVETEKYLSELQVTVNRIEDIKKQRQKNEQSVQKFKDLVEKRLIWSYILDDLNYNLPVDMWLASIELSFTGLQVSTGTVGQAQGQPNAQASQMQIQVQTGAGVVHGVQALPEGQKGIAVSPPVPNTLTIAGYSRSVPSIGIFINNLHKMPYFAKVTLNEIAEDKNNAVIKFKITAMTREGGR